MPGAQLGGTRPRRAVVVLGLAVAATAVAAVSAAWACVPQPRLVALLPQASGPSGTEVTVQGVGFDPPPSRTEIRWNSPDGPELGRAEEANFSVPIKVPNAPAGLYGVLVMSRGADGVLGNAAAATFQVTGPGRVAGASDAPSGASAGAPIPSVTGPTFAPAVIDNSSGPSGITLALGALAMLAFGIFVGTFLRDRASASRSGSEPADAQAGGGAT